MLLAAGMDIDDAADAAIAVKLLPSVSSVICGKLTKEDKTLDEMLELVMGEEHIERCREFVNGIVIPVSEKKTEAKTAPSASAEESAKPLTENAEPAVTDAQESENASAEQANEENIAEAEEIQPANEAQTEAQTEASLETDANTAESSDDEKTE